MLQDSIAVSASDQSNVMIHGCQKNLTIVQHYTIRLLFVCSHTHSNKIISASVS